MLRSRQAAAPGQPVLWRISLVCAAGSIVCMHLQQSLASRERKLGGGGGDQCGDGSRGAHALA
eukprot:4493932-Pleurochrysis_carterae.AAC.1